MNKVVGVYEKHEICLNVITDVIPEEYEGNFCGVRAFEISVDAKNVKVIGIEGNDWSRLIGCEVELGFKSVIGEPDEEGYTSHFVINRVFVTKKTTEGIPEQEVPADE